MCRSARARANLDVPGRPSARRPGGPAVGILLRLLVVLLILARLAFFALESVFWEAEWTEHIRRDLGFTVGEGYEPVAEVAKVAKNQGVSNAFLAAGLAWGLLLHGRGRRELLTFCLAC